MAVTEGGPMFVRAYNCEGEKKDKHFIANLINQVINEVGVYNVVQVVTDNAPVCKSTGWIIEAQYPHIYWTPCVVHTLNLALKNICTAKHMDGDNVVFDECSWISIVANDATFIKNFIMNHFMRLAIFNEHVTLKLLSIAETRFASTLIMLKRFKLVKRGLQNMLISEKWSSYREDDFKKATLVKVKILDDLWWDKIDYIIPFTNLIYDMLRMTDTDTPCLHLIYDMRDTMIEKVKAIIYRHEGKREGDDELTFFSVVYNILVDRWTKSSTPLHCLAHSLNPRYYSSDWLEGGPNRIPPHKDQKILVEREKCFQRYFSNSEERTRVSIEFAKFSACFKEFAEYDSLHNRAIMDPPIWWVVYGSSTPTLQTLALKILGQPSSSSCCERNWSTYSFVHSVKRNKITPQRAKDLVFVHSNPCLLSRKDSHYMKGETKMWDVGGDAFDSLDGTGILEVANLSLDEPEMESILFTDEGHSKGDDDEVIEVGTN